ncbi:MAG TPA: metal ABC transporter ATP-binding protein [Longimicrobiaceae bacterium]|nr:metal ABC transporter ATP-binding protein [Longimicrobiaceae bacterium]
MSGLVTFDGVALGYGRRTVLDGLSFAVTEGDFLGLVGPNGAGKTTVLRAILGTLAPLAGTVTRVPGLRFGYVPQRDQVDYNFPLRVLDVVLMGRYDRIGLARRPGKDDRERAMAALEHVGIPELAQRPLKDLSGGQKQRTLIARALVGEPNVLVLDEPTNGMDLVSTTQILGLVRELHERDNLTVIMVSHALNEVANYVERIALVVGGGFRIGAVDEIMTEPVLSEMYGIPVEVDSFEGHRIVLARRFSPGEEAQRA